MNLKNQIAIIFLMLFSIAARAQSYQSKIYLNDSGTPAEPSKATSYIVYSKQPDSLYYLKQYGMDDTIQMEGGYKDAQFSIPNGKFIYYHRTKNVSIKMIGVIDTLNHVKSIGFFRNGVKDSTWTDYFINGKIESVNTFKNGILNGLYESYNVDSQTILTRGYFVNGLRDGEWNLYNTHGQVVIIENFKNGKKISSKKVADRYIAAVPPGEFNIFLARRVRDMYENINMSCDLSIIFTVNKDGSLSGFSAQGTASDPEVKKEVIAAILDMKGWKAAYMKDTGELVSEVEIVKVRAGDKKYTVGLYTNEVNSRFYELNR